MSHLSKKIFKLIVLQINIGLQINRISLTPARTTALIWGN